MRHHFHSNLLAHSWFLRGCLALVTALGLAGFIAQPLMAQSEPTSLFLPVVSTTTSGNLPNGVSSEHLIETARQAGEISDETALLYRVYANFNDPRLPVEYQGDDTDTAPTLALREVHAQMANLSPATQAALAPFLKPPMAPDSWVEMAAGGEQQAASANNPQDTNATNRITWATTCQTDPNIKVWYQQRHPEDADDAAALCELVRGTIWPRLTSLFGRAPREDSGQNNNGGDGQLDLYLVNARTATVEYAGCFDTPSYILVNRNGWKEHEIVQAVMGAYLNSYAADCMEYMWLYVASRTWAIDYVLPNDNWEHTYADDFLNHTDLSLNTFPLVVPGSTSEFGDGAYLWLWYLTNYVSDAKTVMPAIWENATNPDSLEVVNNAVPGGFAQHWAKFSEQNWNTHPVETYFKDDLLLYSTKPVAEEAVALDEFIDNSFAMDGRVTYLASHTYHFTFDDPTVRSVLFINPFHDGAWPTARINAIYRLADNSWHIEDWTEKYSKDFCRDVVAERIMDLTLVISNHEHQDRSLKLEPAYAPRLNVSNVACRGWEFEATTTLKTISDISTVDETTTINAIFMREKMGDDGDSHPHSMYRVTEGTGAWTHNGASNFCAGSGSGSYTLTGGLQTFLFVYHNATDHTTGTKYMPGDRRYVGFGSEGFPNLNSLTVTYRCKDGTTSEHMLLTAGRWLIMETEPTQSVSDDGVTIHGTWQEIEDSTTINYEWTMTALPPE